MEKKARKLEARKIGRIVLKTFCLLVWVGASLIVSQLVVGLIMRFLLGNSWGQPIWTTVYNAITYSVALVLIVLVPFKLSKRGRTTREEMGVFRWPKWADLGLAPVGFIVYLILAAIITFLFTTFCPWFDAEQVQNVGFENLVGVFDRIVAFLALVVIAPIAEELIFRGWLYGKMRAFLPMPVAILLVSLLFGFMHGQWNVGVNVFAMSIVLCGLREITGTIYSGILLHMIKNGVAFYLLFVAGMA